MSVQHFHYTPVTRRSMGILYYRSCQSQYTVVPRSDSRLLTLCVSMHVLGFSDRPEPRRVKEQLDASVDLLAILGVLQRPHPSGYSLAVFEHIDRTSRHKSRCTPR